MKKTIGIALGVLLWGISIQAQVVTVADLTLKIASGENKELYYGFAAGDEILFSFFETENRRLKEVEVSSWPDQVRYAAYEIMDARDQKITVPATAVYRFRFKNSGLIGERVCRISIRRRPASEDLRMFDTGVRWEERQDTFFRKGNQEWPAWVDNPEIEKRRILVRADTGAVTVVEKTERIFSRSGMLYGSNTAEVKFRLPQNQFLPNRNTPESSTEVIGWAYWIGVGDDADRSYRDANMKAVSKLADVASGLNLISAASGYGALALLAIKGVALFSNPPKGDNVSYTLWNDKGKQLDAGNSIVAFRRMEAPLQGDFLLQLQNDNVVDGINVSIKVLAITLTKAYREEPFVTYNRIPIPIEQRQGALVLRKIRIPFVSGK